jgi:type IX secretion system PorP/SprF family membrane protein
MGFNFTSDRLGPEQNQTFNLAGSYQIRLSEKYRLSAGMSFVGNMRRANLDDLKDLYDLDDPDMARINTFSPNVGGGLLLYSAKNFFGVSLPRFTEYRLTKMDMLPLNQLRHLFVYAGHVFEVNENLWIKPSVLVKFVHGAPTEVDLNAVVHVRKMFDVGFNYRTGDGVGLLAGIKLRDHLILNYVYELPLTDIRYGSLKTHEIGVRYLFGKGPDHSIDSPRFFN